MPKKGGKHITGAFGCTLIPSLIIKDGKRDTEFVTKFFYTEEEYVREKASNELAKQNVDPDGSFLNCIYNEAAIDRSRLTLTKDEATRLGEDFENNVEYCRINTNLGRGKDFNSLRYLNYKYLGNSLESIESNVIRFSQSKQILNALGVLLTKIVSMNRNNFYHNDIHLGNITYKEKDSKCYLIDLGKFQRGPNDTTGRLGIFKDIFDFTRALKRMSNHIISQQRSDIPQFNKDILNQFIKSGGNADILEDIISSSQSKILKDQLSDLGLIQLTILKMISSYEKIEGGFNRKTKKQSSKKRVTLRRRKVGRNVH